MSEFSVHSAIRQYLCMRAKRCLLVLFVKSSVISSHALVRNGSVVESPKGSYVMKYRIVFERESDGRWTVEVPEVPGCHTYGRTIDQARDRVREALSLFVDNAEKAQFDEQINLPDAARRSIRVAKQLRVTLTQTEARMVTAQIDAVKVLRKKLKLGHRDAGALLGLSHQRIQQLEQRPYPAVHPGILTTAERATRRHSFKAAKKR